MQLTTAAMNDDSKLLSTIHEANHHEEEGGGGGDGEFDGIITNGTSSKTNQLNLHSSPKNSSLADQTDRTLNQKFHVAALSGNLSVLQELITKSHISVDCRDRENSTALLLSCARGHYLCAEYLLKNGADSNARRITGASPLYFAASFNYTRIVELLLKQYKAIVDLPTFDGSTSLHVSCERGFTDIVQ
ncbi:unnamed protein product, partial [Rotaria magnacalcarata]